MGNLDTLRTGAAYPDRACGGRCLVLRGELVVTVPEFGDYAFCEASSVISSGTLVGIGLMDPEPTGFPRAFLAKK